MRGWARCKIIIGFTALHECPEKARSQGLRLLGYCSSFSLKGVSGKISLYFEQIRNYRAKNPSTIHFMSMPKLSFLENLALKSNGEFLNIFMQTVSYEIVDRYCRPQVMVV